MFGTILGENIMFTVIGGFIGLLFIAVLLVLISMVSIHNWIKGVSVFVPLGLLILPFVIPYLTGTIQSLYTRLLYQLFVCFGVNAISRMIFNRLRSLPDPS